MTQIKETKAEFKIIEIEDSNNFVISKSQEKIIVYNKEIIDNLISKKFNRKYCELLYIITDILNADDDNGTDTDLLALKIDALRQELINKYYKFLNKATLAKYLKMLLLLEDKLNNQRKTRGR